ncbi:MAG: hypothetical protein UT36_C0008G0018 [Candidatus Peregrinibacteria bacterium GW2011_GWF2_39_17]|nr:MAG: hypothetical protein UT36_C0008G0018 [Candidatus Peregrinibacteria bacterium GW2011_GWF2_39_17]HCW32056.1 hypothetical protein [Candidatus Peregrinibacteria bacterium]
MNFQNQHLARIYKEAGQIIKKSFPNKAYHNINHALFTAKEAMRLFNYEKKFRIQHQEIFPLEQKDRELLIISGITHDIVQRYKKFGKNEEMSAKWLISYLHDPKYFTEHDHLLIKRAILGTKTLLIDDKLIQEVTKYKKRHKPGTVLFSQLLADSDLSGLGMRWPVYWERMSACFKEIYPNPTLQKWLIYLKQQSSILRHFHYHTEAAQKRYHYLKKNAERVEMILKNPQKIENLFKAL